MSYPLSEIETYSLVINSADKVSGTNNNATFMINWFDFLPEKYDQYKVLYTFQSTSGYYCDGFYQKNPLAPTVGVTTKQTTPMTAYPNLIGANLVIFDGGTGVTIGNYVYGTGIPIGATITGVNNFVNAHLSSPITATLYIPSPLQLVDKTTINAVGFSSARVLVNFGGKSYSYDTSSKGQSFNLGVISRDVQTLTSKSNSYSAFYCQNNPRTISRPTNNEFTVAIMNNSVFQGGVVSYNTDNTVRSYGTTASNNNYLCDTANMAQGGKVEGGLMTDMTPWTLTMEFIPILESKRLI